MAICESELCERLESDDDAVVMATLRDHFEPVPSPRPLSYRWCLRPEVVLEPGRAPVAEDESLLQRVGGRLLDLANGAQRMLRMRRYRRVREANPHWPVVVAEGDSWMAHPLVEDITDHLLDDDRYPYAVLGLGAASDLLGDLEAERDHDRAVVEHGAQALLLSGGGNDLLATFGDFLRLWTPGQDPQRLIDDSVDEWMGELMKTLRVMLTRVRTRQPSLPIMIHAYDYMPVGERGADGYLSPFFDEAGIFDPGDRRAALRAIVDRYNAHVAGIVDCVEGVDFLDLRGLVPAEEWSDEIHPNGDGFSRVSAAFGERLGERLG